MRTLKTRGGPSGAGRRYVAGGAMLMFASVRRRSRNPALAAKFRTFPTSIAHDSCPQSWLTAQVLFPTVRLGRLEVGRRLPARVVALLAGYFGVWMGDSGLVPFNAVDLERQPGDVEAAEQNENAKNGEHDRSSAEDREHREDRRIKDERAHADSPNEAKLL
jgi:hypothetical protein